MTTTKDKPVLFKGPMVNAILNGTKTQTRRIVKYNQSMEFCALNGLGNAVFTADQHKYHEVKCPYQVGDILWVRETWRTVATMDAKSATAMAESCKEAGYPEPWAPIRYEADGLKVNWDSWVGDAGRLRAFIFMPRWASRISLEVLSVRVERLQSITEADARAEGCRADVDPFWQPSYGDPDSGGNPSSRNSFEYLWDAINGKTAGASWNANPWVWVYSFKRVKP